MSHLRLHHVFNILLAFSAVVAFLVPSGLAHSLEPQIQIVFLPVSKPSGMLADWISRRVRPRAVADTRPDPDIRQENQELRGELIRLRAQIDELARRSRELGRLPGSLRELCRLTQVVGGDTGARDSISIAGSTLEGLRPDMYVLYPGGLVGQIQSVGALGAQVRLITDPGFRVRVRFWRMTEGEPTPVALAVPPAVLSGAGDGFLSVSRMSFQELGYDSNFQVIDRKLGPTLRENDYAEVDDSDCPAALRGVIVGRVASITPRHDARLFARVLIRPTTNLQRLSEVMVLTEK